MAYCSPGPGRRALKAPPNRSSPKAVELHRAGDHTGAITAYHEYLSIQPDDSQAVSNLGAVYSRLGQYGDAITQYRRALELTPADPGIRFNLGLAYYQSARIRDAAEEFARVAAAQPENRNAVVLLADCRLRMGEIKKVIELLTPFEERHKDDRSVNYLLGTALIRDNQLDKGQVLVNRILRDGDSAEARLMMGTAAMMAREYRDALKEFERARALNPKLLSLNAHHGRAVMAMGDNVAAGEAFARELEVNPNDFDANFYLGVLLKKERQFAQARPYFERALEIRPAWPAARYQLGSLYVSTREIPKAQGILEPLVEEYPEFVEARVSLATVYYRQKRKEDGDRQNAIVRELNAKKQQREPGAGGDSDNSAEPPGEGARPAGEATSAAAAASETVGVAAPAGEASEAPSSGDDDPSFETLAAQAAAARDAGRAGEALELYGRAAAKNPEWAEGLWHIGSLHYTAERYEQARDAFRRLVRLKSRGGVAWAMLGLCDFMLKRYDRALRHLERGRALGLVADSRLNVMARYHLALLLNRAGEPESALRILYGLGAGKDGDDPAIVEALGLSALRLPFLPEEAPADKRAVVQQVGRAQYYLASREVQKAHEEYQRIIERYPSEPNVHHGFGIFLIGNDPDAAMKEFHRELEISPLHAGARLHSSPTSTSSGANSRPLYPSPNESSERVRRRPR